MGTRIVYSTEKLVLGSLTFFYLLIVWGKHNQVYLPELLNSYLTDLLCLPLLLYYCRMVVRKIKNDSTIQLNDGMILFAFIYVSFWFEYWLPLQNTCYTADVIDLICYGIGGMLYRTLQQRFSAVITKP